MRHTTTDPLSAYGVCPERIKFSYTYYSSIIEYLESREVRTSFIPDILHRCYLEPIFHPTFNPGLQDIDE